MPVSKTKSTSEGLYAYDTEVYPNYFLAVFKEILPTKDGEFFSFTFDQREELKSFVRENVRTLVGYNSFEFDDPLLRAIVDEGYQSESDVYALSQVLIENDRDDIGNRRMLNKRRYVDSAWTCIDLMQILGGRNLAGSLKVHEVRLLMPNVQDLPIAPGTTLSKKQKSIMLPYCRNDVHATEELYWDQLDSIEVRYKMNSRFSRFNLLALSRTNSAIADHVMEEELAIRGVSDKQIHKPKEFWFNPARDIDSSLDFISTHNCEVLASLRAISEFPAASWKDISDRFQFKLKDHTITLGGGGLHTRIPAQCVTSKAIVEYDVASYYPSLLRKFDTHPVGLVESWNDIFNDLTDSRLEAKRSGDVAMANVYKIVINSIYGKLLQKSSIINYDPSLQLKVVINGQLYLIKLIEYFQESAFDVITANTDGIYVNAGERVKEAQAIADKWMADTGFSLESDVATIYLGMNVNGYALFRPKDGWYKKKGVFGVGRRTKPSIIGDAVLNHFSTGDSVESIIRKTMDIRDFLYSGSVHVKGFGQVRHGAETLQKTNRWYKSTSRLAIEVADRQADGTLTWKQVPNSANCTVANKLSTFSLPNNLDIDYYVDEAAEVLRKIGLSDSPKPATPPKITREAKKAQKLGFVVVPKGRAGEEKANVSKTYEPETISYWKNTPLEEAYWSNYQGFGTYTGQEFGIVAIDIDVLELAVKTKLFKHLTTGGVVAWHGKVDSVDVRDGKYRGTLLFLYDGDVLRTTGGRFKDKHGFEILYGKKVAQLAGNHPDGDTYQYQGKLTKLPEKLRKYLESLDPEVATYPPTDEVVISDDESEGLLNQFMVVANKNPEYLALGGSLKFEVPGKDVRRLIGRCIGHIAHTNKFNEQTMTVSVWQGRPRVQCFHNSCSAIIRRWESTICKGITVTKKVVVKPERVIIHDEQKDIANALNATAKHKLIVAPTGSGKTHSIVTYIAPFLDSASGNSDKFVIICSSIDQMQNIAETFSQILDSANINDLGIDLIEASQSMKVDQATSRDLVRPGARVAITHYTYVSRKKFSKRYYSFLRFIDSDTHVFIDEIDAFIDSQTVNYPIGSRWKRLSKEGRFKNVRQTKCGMSAGSNNCTNCLMRPYDGNRMSIDDYHNVIYTGVGEFMDGDRLVELDRIELDSRIHYRIPVGNTEIQMLRQEPHPTEVQFDDETDYADFISIMEDHLNSAYLPTIHRPIITFDGEEIRRDQAIAQLHLTEGSSWANLPEEERRRFHFPRYACNVLTLTMVDRRSFIWMRGAKSVTGLTATLTPFQIRFLGDMFEGLTLANIPPSEDLKMDKIVVVGMKHKISVKMIVDEHWQFDKMFRFRETKKKAESDFNTISKSNVLIRLGINTRRFETSGEDERGEHKILQTYSFGSLGRGVNFGKYDLIDVNASIYKPIAAYVTDDPEMIKNQVLDDRASTLTQNIGRILRRDKKKKTANKVVVLEELNSEEELSAVVKRIAPMSHTLVESWWVPEFLAPEEVCEWLTQISSEKTLPPDLPKSYLDLIGRAEKMIADGEDKKSIRKKLRWDTIQKSLTLSELDEIEARIDELLDTRDPSIRRGRLKTDEKIAKTREKRERKIRKLQSEGKTAAQIHSRMRINGWAESERSWFEGVIQRIHGS